MFRTHAALPHAETITFGLFRRQFRNTAAQTVPTARSMYRTPPPGAARSDGERLPREGRRHGSAAGCESRCYCRCVGSVQDCCEVLCVVFQEIAPFKNRKKDSKPSNNTRTPDGRVEFARSGGILPSNDAQILSSTWECDALCMLCVYTSCVQQQRLHVTFSVSYCTFSAFRFDHIPCDVRSIVHLSLIHI